MRKIRVAVGILLCGVFFSDLVCLSFSGWGFLPIGQIWVQSKAGLGFPWDRFLALP